MLYNRSASHYCSPLSQKPRNLGPDVMHARIETFLYLCACLAEAPVSTAPPNLRQDGDAGAHDWDLLLELALRHSVSPSLWRRLRERKLVDAVPSGARNQLKMRHHVNAIKNARFLDEAREIAAGLNGVGVVPIVLKGGVPLFEEAARESECSQMMHDLDFLVRQEDLDRSVRALSDMGYRPIEGMERWTYHYPPLARPGALAPIDLHVFVGQQRDVVSPEAAWRKAVALPADGVDLMALSPTHRVIHNVFHSQVQDRGHSLALVYLKQLLRLDQLCRRHGQAIDWIEVRQTMDSHGLGKYLAYRLYLARRLLAMPLPEEVTPSRGAAVYYHRCLFSIRSRRFQSALLLWAGATAPFKAHNIDLIYNCGRNPLVMAAYRLRHGADLFARHWRNIGEKVLEKRKLYE